MFTASLFVIALQWKTTQTSIHTWMHKSWRAYKRLLHISENKDTAMHVWLSLTVGLKKLWAQRWTDCVIPSTWCSRTGVSKLFCKGQIVNSLGLCAALLLLSHSAIVQKKTMYVNKWVCLFQQNFIYKTGSVAGFGSPRVVLPEFADPFTSKQATFINAKTALRLCYSSGGSGWEGSQGSGNDLFFSFIWLLILLLCLLCGNSSFCALLMCTLFCVVLFFNVKFALEAANKQMSRNDMP